MVYMDVSDRCDDMFASILLLLMMPDDICCGENYWRLGTVNPFEENDGKN